MWDFITDVFIDIVMFIFDVDDEKKAARKAKRQERKAYKAHNESEP